jgi:AhpD family alkylhydroperoxidase
MRLTPVNPGQTKSSVKDTLDELAARGGELGPMVLTMANSSALLRGYADLNRAMKRSHLDRTITERISLAVQEWLGCSYCIAAHSDAARALGLTDTDIELARQGTATDAKIAAIVAFAHGPGVGRLAAEGTPPSVGEQHPGAGESRPRAFLLDS